MSCACYYIHIVTEIEFSRHILEKKKFSNIRFMKIHRVGAYHA
jgi:hypothetical protein